MNTFSILTTSLRRLVAGGLAVWLAAGLVACGTRKAENPAPDDAPQAAEVTPEMAAARSRIATETAAANAQCPLEAARGCHITSIGVEGENMVYTYEIDDELLAMEPSAFEEQGNVLRESIMRTFERPDSPERQLWEDVSTAGYGLKIVMDFTKARKIVTARITNDEIRERLAADLSAADAVRRQLAASLEVANAQCPLRVDNETVMTAVALEGDRAVYYYAVDEAALGAQVNDLAPLADSMKEAIRNNLATQNGLANEQFVDLLIRSNVELVCRYEGTETGQQMVLTFTPAELRSL